MFIKDHKAFVFTPEIVHTLIPVTIGGLSAVGGFLFGRGVGERRMSGNGFYGDIATDKESFTLSIAGQNANQITSLTALFPIESANGWAGCRSASPRYWWRQAMRNMTKAVITGARDMCRRNNGVNIGERHWYGTLIAH